MEKPELNLEVEEKTTKKQTKKKEVQVEEKTKTWKEVFIANYTGVSEEAKMIEPHLKTTFKGDPYIPWAVMERLVYMCDENAEFTNICNENGGLVHTDVIEQHQLNASKGEVISETVAPMYAHFVKVALVFMGKVFTEDYPIQDQDYSAAKVFNQNLVNRALQRARAKLGARATGLGLKLYEGGDLQFDTKEDKKPELPVKEEPKVVEKPKKETKKVEMTEEQKVANIVDGGVTEAYLSGERTFTTQDVPVENSTISAEIPVEASVIASKNPTNPAVLELANLIKTTDAERMIPVLQRVNASIMKKYTFALSTNDSEAELIEKISQFPNPEQFKKTIINLLG